MTKAVLSMLIAVSRHGRSALIVGLLAGFLLPGLATALKPWLPQLVMVLLFLVALRIGPQKARDGLSNLPATLGIVLVLQLILPLGVVGVAQMLEITQSAYVLAAVLVLAAPAVSGSPNLSIMLGADPEPAFRLLIVGTFLLPLTILPIFWLLPQFGDLAMATTSALRTLVVIMLAMGAGFLLRGYRLPDLKPDQSAALDGAMSIALAFGLNIGLQVLSFVTTRKVLSERERVPVSIVAGNRNIAIFLVALPASIADPLLIFLGCYQVPMYLTPLILERLYRSKHRSG
jgi:ACR3 family arsenite transporter